MKKTSLLTAALLTPITVRAHCPLCTAGAAGAAGVAAYMGVSAGAIGVFLGAFAAAIGLWIARMIKKEYIPMQETALVIISFVTTILPLLPLLSTHHALYVPFGEYGTTLAVNTFLTGSILGLAIMLIGPNVSNTITAARKTHIPYQGMIVVFTLLVIAAISMQVAV